MAKQLQGKIVSVKMQDTVVVSVGRSYRHPLYKKTIHRNKKYKAHYENMELEVGNEVVIEETRPISKDKHFKVVGLAK